MASSNPTPRPTVSPADRSLKNRGRDSLVPTPDELYLVNAPPKAPQTFGGEKKKKRHGEQLLSLGGEKFPTYSEMEALPDEIKSTLMVIVHEYFTKVLYPRMMLLQRWKQKRNAIAAALPSAPTVPVSFLQSVPLFSRWNNLDSLARTLQLRVYDRDELIVMQGDHTQSGVFFLVQGTIHIRKRKPGARRKGYSDAVTTLVGTLEGLQCYGEKIFLTEEPRLETLRAATRCLVWVLYQTPFFQHFDSLPEDRRRLVVDYAYVTRRENLMRVFPVTAADLQRVPLFSHVPTDMLASLVPRLESRVFPAKHNICRMGDVGSEMYYIVRGQVSVRMLSLEGEETAVSTATKGSILGEMSVLFAQKRHQTLVCLTPVDCYMINRDTLTQAITSSSVMSEVLRKAHKLQAEWQTQAKSRFIEYIAEIPFVKHLASKKCLQKLLDSFTTRVYPSRSTILSVSECADRLVIFTRGKARAAEGNMDLHIGECVGYTSLVPHRWKYHVVALDAVESIELPYEAFRAILKEFDVYEDIKRLCFSLVYPRVYPEAFQRALGMVRHCVNPPCYPVSTEYHMKPFAARTHRSKLDIPGAAMPAFSSAVSTGGGAGSLFGSDGIGAGGGGRSGGGGGGVVPSLGALRVPLPPLLTQSIANDVAAFIESLDQMAPMAEEGDSSFKSQGGGTFQPKDALAGRKPPLRRTPEVSLSASASMVARPELSKSTRPQLGALRNTPSPTNKKPPATVVNEVAISRNEVLKRSRHAEEVQRLQERIRELQRLQTASHSGSVPRSTASTGEHSPAGRLPPLRDGGQSHLGSEGGVIKKSVSVACQTTRSFLEQRARLLALTKGKGNANTNASGNSPVPSSATAEPVANDAAAAPPAAAPAADEPAPAPAPAPVASTRPATPIAAVSPAAAEEPPAPVAAAATEVVAPPPADAPPATAAETAPANATAAEAAAPAAEAAPPAPAEGDATQASPLPADEDAAAAKVDAAEAASLVGAVMAGATEEAPRASAAS